MEVLWKSENVKRQEWDVEWRQNFCKYLQKIWRHETWKNNNNINNNNINANIINDKNNNKNSNNAEGTPLWIISNIFVKITESIIFAMYDYCFQIHDQGKKFSTLPKI